MNKIKKQNGFLGFRTTKEIEEHIKFISMESNKDVSDILNYLCRVFLEDKYGIRSNFVGTFPKEAILKWEK